MQDIESMVRKASKKVDEAEIYYRNSEGYSVETSGKLIEAVNILNEKGYGLRVVNKGRIGFSYFSEESQFEKALKTAISSAKLNEKLDISFSEKKKKYRKPMKIYDSDIRHITEEKMIELSMEMVNSAKKAEPLKGFSTFSFDRVEIANSNKLYLKEKSTLVSAELVSIFKNSSTGLDFRTSRLLDFDFSEIGKKSSKQARDSYKPKKFEGEVPIILSPLAAMQVFSAMFIPNINGESIRRGKSNFSGRKGEKVASKITVLDDGKLKAGVASHTFDDEGTATARKKIIDRGVLKGFLFDLKNSFYAGEESTGSGFRDSFSSEPVIAPSNIIIKGKKRDLMSEIERGVYITSLMPLHTSNPTTGDFAVPLDTAFFFEKGSMKYPIRAGISGNFFDLLEKIEAGREAEKVDWFISPPLFIGSQKLMS